MIDRYEDLNIGTLIRLSAIPEEIDPLDRQVEILAVLSGCSPEDILALPLEEYSRRVIASQFLDRELPRRLPQKSYRCGGFDLVPVRDMRRTATAQFIDFKKFADQAEGDGEKLSSLTVELLSCMLVPKGHSYCDDYDPVEVQEAIRDGMRADDAVALSAFFLALWIRSSRHILISSRREARKLKMRGTLEKIKRLRTVERMLTSSPGGGGGSV